MDNVRDAKEIRTEEEVMGIRINESKINIVWYGRKLENGKIKLGVLKKIMWGKSNFPPKEKHMNETTIADWNNNNH